MRVHTDDSQAVCGLDIPLLQVSVGSADIPLAAHGEQLLGLVLFAAVVHDAISVICFIRCVPADLEMQPFAEKEADICYVMHTSGSTHTQPCGVNGTGRGACLALVTLEHEYVWTCTALHRLPVKSTFVSSLPSACKHGKQEGVLHTRSALQWRLSAISSSCCR